jgi:hypothetical protein
MQEFTNPEPVEPTKVNTVDDFEIQKNAEAFLNLATDLPPEEAQEPITPMEKKKTQSRAKINLGPKYLDALSQIESLNQTGAFEIQLPVSLDFLEITSMTGEEEQALKSASVSPETFLKKLNEVIYNHAALKKAGHLTFREFLSNMYPPDKSAAIFGMLVSSYAVLPTIEKKCESCGKSYVVEEAPENLIHDDTFKNIWDKELPPNEYTEIQSVFDGFIKFEIGMPSETDRLIITSIINPGDIADNVEKNDSVFDFGDTLVFFTKSIIVKDTDGQEIVLTDLTQDIYPFIKNLSPKMKDRIRADIDLSVFDKYLPDFYLNAECTHCHHQEKIEVDPELTFFRKTISV